MMIESSKLTSAFPFSKIFQNAVCVLNVPFEKGNVIYIDTSPLSFLLQKSYTLMAIMQLLHTSIYKLLALPVSSILNCFLD